MKPVELYIHPSETKGAVKKVNAKIERTSPDHIRLTYTILDSDEDLAIPEGDGIRRDGLWLQTCLEFFLGRASEDSYREFNFSPGGDWAAYSFDRARQGKRQLLMPEDPKVAWRRDKKRWVLEADLMINDLPENGACNLTAVIGEKDGTKTHWAALHAPDAPDFHDPLCFSVPFPSLAKA
ncbi:DOMON-like domain-containing protein [Sphingomicrobium clamense]|uniref:DOMON-like domain-containing protein n=1 Tax=Sphingomicrobium clamense TaxID=2851013 RepID=A0ABS6V6H7_9SPHN|nr:DOMON-like domain-containing protein [Sphingomicrobium sp. B8]MBW0145076.1 DOMON-like domain-containing protein [Sphingomicrobium sp. B8]